MIGKTLANFRITAKLGEGGMGEVYRAEDTRLGREVAIKVLPEGMTSDPARMARFEREARVLASLSHPNIAAIFQVEEAEGLQLLVMELVEGEDLAERIIRGPLPVDEVVTIGLEIARALEAAHENGIVHRDLKPANILVGADGRARVLDFGLAKLQPTAPAGSQEATLAALTVEGAIVGTVPYMSPEQVAGKPVDHRTDFFSLGAILHEMCAGQRPFHGESSTHVMSAILRDRPPPLSELRSDLPERLVEIVDRCLEKEPGERYQTAREVRAELEDLRRQVETGEAEPARSARRANRWLVPAVAVGALAIALLVVLRPGAKDATEPAGERPPAAEATRQMIVVLPFENLGQPEDEYFAAGMTDEITSRLSGVTGLGVISRKGALRYAGSDKTSREVGDELGVAYILSGSVRWDSAADGSSRVRITPELVRAADDTQLWSYPYDRVLEDIFDVQSEIAGQVIESLGVTLLAGEEIPLDRRPTENLEAYTLYLKGRYFWYQRTAASVQKGLEFFEQAVELDPGYALPYVGIADTWIFRGFYSVVAPKDSFPHAKRAALSALALDNTLAEAHTSLAHIHFEFDHDWEAARHEYERAIELNPRYQLAHHWYGGFLSAMGQHEEALAQARTARRLDPFNLIVSTWVGLRHYFAGRYEVAIDEFRKTLEMGNFLPAHWHLGWAYEQTGRYREAILEAEAAIAMSDGNPLFLTSLGHAYAVAGEEEKARSVLAELRRASETRHVSAYHTAVIYAALGDVDEALHWMDLALEERSPWIGYMRVDPRLDPLRADPRLALLLQRASLDF